MDNYTFGEIFEKEESSSTRPRRSVSQFRPSYNENLMAPSIGDNDNGEANVSTFPCVSFMQDAGIYEDFLLLVSRCGLTTYMNDESNQYALLTKTFVESFTFTNNAFRPRVEFKIYDRSVTMPLKDFCRILDINMFGTTKKIQDRPADLLELYREVSHDDGRIAQRGKIRNIQLPAIRYFVYYLGTSILGRENTSNISHYHLAFLTTALNNSTKYNLGALIARRLAAKGPIYGGIIAARVLAALGARVRPDDVLLTPQRLDLATMKSHQFVTSDSYTENLIYRVLFNDGDEREVPLPQPTLFSIRRKPWSRSKEELDEQLGLLDFHMQHGPVHQEEEAPSTDHTVRYTGASSSTYQDEGASSSYYGGNAAWSTWKR